MIKILVVEDETAINRMLCMNLGIVGYETVAFSDGQQLLNYLADGGHDDIKTFVEKVQRKNIRMPDLNICTVAAFLPGSFEHAPGKIRGDEMAAFPCDMDADHACTAGAFQDAVPRTDL